MTYHAPEHKKLTERVAGLLQAAGNGKPVRVLPSRATAAEERAKKKKTVNRRGTPAAKLIF